MINKINETVSVSFTFNGESKTVSPKAMVWRGRLHAIKKVGLHHKFRQGKTLYHVFSVAGNGSFFRLILNTDTLHWKLDKISDNLPN